MLRSLWLSRSRLALVLVLVLVPGCAAVERAAANDPQKCERNPKCESKQGNSRDCATSCADNIECMERCQQINGRR
ncbi:hypothetical protein BH09MYX1_BH09MYX1_35660 [soil metagenome]